LLSSQQMLSIPISPPSQRIVIGFIPGINGISLFVLQQYLPENTKK
jgi:hypothetical protein